MEVEKSQCLIKFVPGFIGANRELIAEALKGMTQEALSDNHLSKQEKKVLENATPLMYELTARQITIIANRLHDYKEGLNKQRTIFAVCENSPRAGAKSIFSVYFVNEEQGVERFNPQNLWPLFCMRDNRYFSSGIFGMSRVLAATDILFETIRHITGYYAQIDTI